MTEEFEGSPFRQPSTLISAPMADQLVYQFKEKWYCSRGLLSCSVRLVTFAVSARAFPLRDPIGMYEARKGSSDIVRIREHRGRSDTIVLFYEERF